MEIDNQLIGRNKITFMTKEVPIVESRGRRKFYMNIDEEIYNYEKRMLCGSKCPYSLPMSFLTEEGEETACYDFTGFVQLTEYIDRIAARGSTIMEGRNIIRDVIDILTGILECLKGMENYLIYAERVLLCLDVIFIDQENKKINILFYTNDRKELSVQDRIAALTRDLAIRCSNQEAGQYLNKFIDLIGLKNPGLEGMIGILAGIQREVSYIYWNTKDFRNTVENNMQMDTVKQESKSNHIKELNKMITAKPLLIQAVFIVGLAVIFLSGRLETSSFAGLTILAAGTDLWIMKRLRYIKC